MKICGELKAERKKGRRVKKYRANREWCVHVGMETEYRGGTLYVEGGTCGMEQ